MRWRKTCPIYGQVVFKSVASDLALESREIHGSLLTDGSFETAETVNPDYAVINNTEIGDLIFIPQNAVHLDDAKKFLIYLNRHQNVLHATEKMFIARPFRYTPSEVENLTDFTKSVFSVYENPDAVQIVRTANSNIFIYAGIKELADALYLCGRTVSEIQPGTVFRFQCNGLFLLQDKADRVAAGAKSRCDGENLCFLNVAIGSRKEEGRFLFLSDHWEKDSVSF